MAEFNDPGNDTDPEVTDGDERAKEAIQAKAVR